MTNITSNITREEINKDIQKEIIKQENSDKRKKLIKKFIKYLLLLLFFVFLFLFYTSYFSTTGFIINDYKISNKKIPDSFDGFKIIQFSDLHYGSTIFENELSEIISLINKSEPDIVIFTGDLINKNYNLSSKSSEKIISKLNDINASLGKYAISGEEDGKLFNTIFNQSGFTILNNSSDYIYSNDDSRILINGISYSKDNKLEFSNFINDETSFNITILHQPDKIDEIEENLSSDLILAGHSHNGSIVVPYVTSLFKPDGSKKYYKPFYMINNTPIYISSGLGTNNKLGFRLYCRPSISIIRLKK